jgi:hypothetical protein
MLSTYLSVVGKVWPSLSNGVRDFYDAADILHLALDSFGYIRAYPILNVLSISGKPSRFGFDRITALRKVLVETFRASVGEELLNSLKVFLAAEGRDAKRDN